MPIREAVKTLRLRARRSARIVSPERPFRHSFAPHVRTTFPHACTLAEICFHARIPRGDAPRATLHRVEAGAREGGAPAPPPCRTDAKAACPSHGRRPLDDFTHGARCAAPYYDRSLSLGPLHHGRYRLRHRVRLQRGHESGSSPDARPRYIALLPAASGY